MINQQKVTVKDVARVAGVSPGTVSNALSGKRPVSAATRTKVLEAIAELDYHPNLLARGLVSRQSGTLAVVATGLEYYGPSRTLTGIEAQATELGYSLLLDLLPNIESPNIDDVLQGLTARRVDGIIWAVHQVRQNHDWVTPERLSGLPPMVFLAMEPRPELSIVSTNNRKAAELATRHLIDSGHRKIGIITGPATWWEAQERTEGWRTTLRAGGLPCDETLMIEGDWSAAGGEAALEPLLARHHDLDAVYASNDQMALGILRAAHLRGIRIPDDLAVVGCDNIPESACFWPALTTVRQHLVDAGRLAVELLQSMILAELEEEAPHTVPTVQHVAPQLIVRESCGARSGA